MLGSLGNGASLLPIPDSSSESGDQTRQNHPRVRWSGLQSTHPQESTQETGHSEQPQGERGAPISQMRKLRLSGKEGTTCPLQSWWQDQLRDKLQESSPALGVLPKLQESSRRAPPPSAHEGLEPPPLLHPLHRRGGERKDSGPRSLPRAALVPGLPRGVTACAGSCPCSLQVQPHTSPPPPVLAWGTKAAEAAQPEAHKPGRAASGSHRSQTSGGQGRLPGPGACRPHWPPTRALQGALGLGASSSSSVVLITTALSWDKLAAILPALLSQHHHPVQQGLCDKL